MAAVIGLVAAMLAGFALAAPPAYAQGPADVTVAASGNPNLTVGGGAQRVAFTVGNNGPGDARGVGIQINVPLADQGVTITHGPDGCQLSGNTLRCAIENVPRGASEQIRIQISPPSDGGPEAGQSQQGQGSAQVGYQSDPVQDNNTAGFTVTLNGPEKPSGVPSVSGKVTDNKTNKPVAEAKVVITDSESNKRRATTDDSGQYSITATDEKPIAAGSITITVTKKGYEKRELIKTGRGGQPLKADILMIPTAKPSKSAKPTAKNTKSKDDGEEEEGTSWLAWLFYIFAALLVLGGIGLIIWLFKGGRDDELDEDADDEYGDPHRRPGGAAPIGAHGVYRSDPYGSPTHAMGGTQPTAVVGGDAPTSMMERPGMDQPTSMINRVGVDQPTSMIDRSSIDQPTRPHSTVQPDNDVYPEGREKYATGHGYGPGSGYGEPTRGDLGGPRAQGYPADPGYGGAQPGYGSSPGYGRDRGYGGDPGYGSHGAQPGGHHAVPPPQDPYRDQGYDPPSTRRARREDRRLDWYED